MRSNFLGAALCVALGVAALFPLGVLADSPNLLLDGGFESPVVAPGTFQLFGIGQPVGAWRVVGAAGDVGIINGSFVQQAARFPAASGRQSLDLTGLTNTATGVEQTVPTTPGSRYRLDFKVGTVNDPSGIFGTNSTAVVLVDGRRIFSATNSAQPAQRVQVWQPFSITFVASATRTTIAFINGDPPRDNLNGLDDVSLTLDGGDLASFASLPTPSDAFGSVTHNAAVLAVAGGVTLFITFPAQLFNHTLEENYEDIVGFARTRIPWRRRPRGEVERRDISPVDVARVGIVIGLGAVCGGLLDPTFGFTVKSLQTFVSVILTVLFFMAVGGAVGSGYRRVRDRGRSIKLVALPAGLLIAAACVLISRVSNFQPGYLYGVIAGVAFVESISEREEAHVAQLGALTTLVVAGLAWLLWSLVDPFATAPGALFPVLIVDNVLAGIFVGGITGSVIGLLPLRFLPGGRIASWRRLAWGATFVIAIGGLVGVLLWPNHHSPGAVPVATAVGLLVVFGGSSVGFWWFFDRRRRRLAAAASAAG